MCCWTFPGSESDRRIIRTVRDDLGSWNLHRLVWVADAGFAAAANRASRTRGGGHYIHAEKLRHTKAEATAAWPARRNHDVADHQRVKQVRVAPGGGTAATCAPNGSWCATTPDAAVRDEAVRERRIEHLRGLIDGSDAWPKTKRDEPGRLPAQQARAAQVVAPHQGRAAAHRQRRRERETTPTPRGCCASPRTTWPPPPTSSSSPWNAAGATPRAASGCARSTTTARTASALTSNYVGWHCFLIRVAETRTGDTWLSLCHELDRIHLVTLATANGRAHQGL